VELRALGRKEEWEYSSQSLEKEEKRRRIEKEKEEQKKKENFEIRSARRKTRTPRFPLPSKSVPGLEFTVNHSGRKNRTCYKFSGPLAIKINIEIFIYSL